MRNTIEFHNNHIKKIFVGENDEEKKHIKGNFTRELSAYKKFAELNADFVPKLLQYDYKKLTLILQKISGLDLISLFNQNENELVNDLNIDKMIDQLISIDAFLYNNKINVLQTSPRDLIYDIDQRKIFLTDFEFTIVGSSYRQILYDRMFKNHIYNTTNVNLRNLFLYSLKKRKKEFKLYCYRKLKNYIIKRIRLFLPLPKKKEYQNSQINVLY
ncbi:MAG: hypothetical protein AB1767_10410 [Bacillota bacterium]